MIKKRKTALTLMLIIAGLLGSVHIFAQQRETQVSGSVRDAITGDPIVDATFIIKGRVVGGNTDLEGNFNFGINLEPPFTLIFSAVGYDLREYEITEFSQVLQVRLRTKTEFSTPYVKQAVRREENLLQSTVSVQKNNIDDIRTQPSTDFYEGLADLRDVQMLTSGLTYQSINTRGFASVANPRMVQIIDGVDNAPPGLNYSLGNMVGISPLDVAEIELVSGPSSALYGPNAFNGILFMNSKSPFDYTGLSAMMKNGITSEATSSTNPFIETALRYSEPISDNFAVKFNLSYFRGTDWQATDYSDLDAETVINPQKGRGINPAYDGVNIYGDEIAQTFSISNDGSTETVRVSRTGYEEQDLTSNLAESVKFDASFHLRFGTTDVVGQYRLGYGNGQFQATNRYVFRDLMQQQFKLEAVDPNFTLRAYATFEDAGNSYDMRFLSWNLNRAWKSDEDWFTDYAAAYSGGVDANWTRDHDAAREYADRDRLVPGTQQYEVMFDSISTLADPARGSMIVDKSRMYHVEGLYDFTNMIKVVNFMVGGNYRSYQLNSEGNLFNDADGAITITEFGGFAQLSKSILDDRLQFLLSARYDKNANFDGRFTPRASIVYSGGRKKEHNLRVTYQTGFRNPSNQSQYIGLDIGILKLLGGAQDNISNYAVDVNLDSATTVTITGQQVYDNAYTAASVQSFASTGDASALTQATVNPLVPEQVTTLEVGYRGIFNKRMFLDLTYFRNTYTNLITTADVIVPLTGSVADGSGATDIANGDFAAFQLYTNVEDQVSAQGISASFNLLLDLDFRLFGSYNYTALQSDDINEAEIPGFNTPTNRFTVGLSNANLYKGFGFKASTRWSDSYMWRSNFAEGEIPVINITNLQFTYDVPESNIRLKIGGSNIFNQSYQLAVGLPSVGAQYYFQITFNEF